MTLAGFSPFSFAPRSFESVCPEQRKDKNLQDNDLLVAKILELTTLDHVFTPAEHRYSGGGSRVLSIETGFTFYPLFFVHPNKQIRRETRITQWVIWVETILENLKNINYLDRSETLALQGPRQCL